MTKVVALIALILFVGCTSNSPSPSPSPVVVVGCQVESSMVSSISAALAIQGQCAHADVMSNDMMTWLGKANICAQSTGLKGPIGDAICPIAVQAILNGIGQRMPPTWGCDLVNAPAAASLTASCSSAVGI